MITCVISELLWCCSTGWAAASDSFATGTQVGQNGVNAVFVDRAQGFCRYAQTHPAVFAFYPETAGLQVRKKTSTCFVVCVRNIVARDWAFAGNLAYACH